MDRTLLLGVAGLLTFALVTGVITLAKSGQARRLKERVANASAIEVRTTHAAGLPSIRLQTGRQRPFLERILRFLRFNPDTPQEQVIPWWATLLIGSLIGVIAGYYMGFLLGRGAGALIGLGMALFAVRGLFAWQHNNYVDAIFVQIPDAIGLMVRAIRAGLPVGEAIRSVAAELANPLRDEFARVLGDVAIGRPLDQALLRLHARTELPEFSFLAVVFGLQSQTGGNLAETLDNLADIVRKRVAMTKRAKALAAEARMQAGILMALPYVAALAMSQIQPFYIDNFFRNPSGQRLVLIGLGFSVFGWLVIRWMIKKAGTD
ncbi:type II secretion system F family protein [Roseomonas sp. HJA6]|uniref:Type II secretion system F family protein n=1 Tax=Roseomonas alba TaxID=2846776 RepID=A0ABS7A3Y5_9PROT|nr:type II secretion system F family protein [Neoroseomonas alba]MBW6396810.1 type II secretion system F family protein [Neoroseomonas alba]